MSEVLYMYMFVTFILIQITALVVLHVRMWRPTCMSGSNVHGLGHMLWRHAA